MSLPRMASISASLSSNRLVPSNRMAPPTIRPGGSATRRRTDNAVTLLPQPDSPTTPKTSPARTLYETPSTARTTPAAVKKWVCKLSISSSGFACVAPGSAGGLAIGSKSFKSDTCGFDDILIQPRAIRARRAPCRKEPKGRNLMTDPHSTHPWWNRRDFLKNGVALAGAYGMGWGLGHAADVPYEFD